MPGVPFVANYDEAKAGTHSLPDPLRCEDGSAVADARTWWESRRPEVLRLFENEMFGRGPGSRAGMETANDAEDGRAFDGLAVRRQISLRFRASGPDIHLLVYLPAAATGPSPMIIAPNFLGNQTVAHDPGIHLSDAVFVSGMDVTLPEGRATEASRGQQADRWPVDHLIRRGYGLATFFYGDAFPDRIDGRPLSPQPLFDEQGASFSWGAIATWSWAMSRALDALATLPEADMSRVALFGHSRHGKAALWAAALDRRFRLVIANNSGKGGASLARRNFGETISHLVTRYPHWFAPAYASYAGREAELPFDQHMLIALIAPRPVYIASAEEDLWADPKGEFLAAQAADPVYRLLGVDGLAAKTMPPPQAPVLSTIGYHIRRGGHGVTLYDWERFLDFADRHMK